MLPRWGQLPYFLIHVKAYSMIRSIFVLALFLLAVEPACAAQAQVHILYNPAMDSACSFLRNATIKDEWKAELSLRKAEFEGIWQEHGPRMILAAETITGKSFPADIDAHLSLCDLPSQSMVGVSINMRYALNSFTATPVPLRYKADTLFHELLHVLLSSYSLSNSSLLAQHAAEHERVRSHLHLLALQKAVLIQLREPEILKQLIAIDSQLPSGHYRRAWDIVNATDTTYLQYVEELRN